VSNSEDAATTQSSGPKVLFVYYTFTKQAARVADAMAEVLRGEGWEVTEAAIEFTDKRYSASSTSSRSTVPSSTWCACFPPRPVGRLARSVCPLKPRTAATTSWWSARPPGG
jgi:hypothetical protein